MIRLLAPAKVNLGLRVHGKREDGFHYIETVFQAVGLYDELFVEEADRFSFRTTGEWDAPEDETNLVVRAIRLLGEVVGREPTFSVALHKRIPSGGGLGGGSSDAVAGLLAANRIWGDPLTLSEIVDLSGQLGSDCPFFVYGGCQQAWGRGEKLRKVEVSLLGAFAIWYPGVSVSTAFAYASLGRNLTREQPPLIFHDCLNSTPEWWSHPAIVNHFEPVVSPRIPGWDAAVSFWKNHGSKWVALSGSGACQVAYFTSPEQCQVACDSWNGGGFVWVAAPVSCGVRFH